MSSHRHETRNLGLSIVINSFIFVSELVGGLLTNSLALISDAFHNLSDVIALVLSYATARLSTRKSNEGKTWGYGRYEILAAFINAVALIAVGGYIIYEGVHRFSHPAPVAGKWMMIIAATGFVANSASTLLLRGDAKHNLNSRSAFLHLLTDAIESLGVVVVGILIYWKSWHILDPFVSIAIGVFIIKSTWSILVEAVDLLTEGIPRGVDFQAVAAFIGSFPGIESVHHLHIWGVKSGFTVLSAHLVVSDQLISQGTLITKDLGHALETKFNISHPMFQLESAGCPDQGLIVSSSDTQ